jgi:hypothetical protein
MIKRIPIYPDINKEDYNNGGMHEYDPYSIKNNNIEINKRWWESLTPYIQNLIKSRRDIQIEPKEILKMLDQSYLDGFDYHIWQDSYIEDFPQNVEFIYINKDTKKLLLDLHDHKVVKSKKLDKLKIQIAMKMNINTQYFMRLSATSGKNYRAVKPMCNVEEVIDNLIKNDIFVKREYLREKDTYLFLMPWNDKIEKRNEFRIFVKGGKLTGITQQWWSQLFNYTQEELEIFEKAFTNISFLDKVEYKDWIGDVYVDMDEQKCKLIEINPFGAHCGAGSGLFNWKTDYDKLYGLVNGEEVEFRYQSIIKY